MNHLLTKAVTGEATEQPSHPLSGMQYVIIILLSFFSVFGTWSFWSYGVSALGLNACVIGLGFSTLLAYQRDI